MFGVQTSPHDTNTVDGPITGETYKWEGGGRLYNRNYITIRT